MRSPKTMTRQPSAQSSASLDELHAKLAALESEQASAHEEVQQAEATWRSALADVHLREGQKTAVNQTRSRLDRVRENLLGLDGAVEELQRRIAAALESDRNAKVAHLVERAHSRAADLHAAVDELLHLDAKAATVLERIAQIAVELKEIKGQHQDLDPDGLGPGEMEGLAARLWNGLAADSSPIGRTAIVLAHHRLAEFGASWGHGQARRILGVKDQTEQKER